MFFLYILYSESADRYYVDYTSNMDLRLKQHNENFGSNSYTSIYRPWKIAALFKCGEDKSAALKLEQFIKKQHSRNLLIKLIEPTFQPTGILASLERVLASDD